MCLFLCCLSINAKTTKYKGNGLLKECKIKTSKSENSYRGVKTYTNHIVAEIEGQIVDINDNSISNQPIYLKFNKKVSTFYSNNDGIFKYELNDNFVTNSKKLDTIKDLEILLQFDNKSKREFKIDLKNGNDCVINTPHKISITLDKEQEYLLYLEENDLREKIINRNGNDVIILSSQIVSAEYYRQKIAKEKEEALLETKKKLKENNIHIKAEELILNSNDTLRQDWKSVLEVEIQKRNALLYAKKRLKETGINNINIEEVLLTNGNLNENWEKNLEKQILIEAKKQAKQKLEKQTGYTYYNSDIEALICDTDSDFIGKRLKSNWKQLVNKEIQKEEIREQKEEIKEP